MVEQHDPERAGGILDRAGQLDVIARWRGVAAGVVVGKRQAIDGLAGVFDGSADSAGTASEAEVEKLHAKIGQLVVERDFLAKAFGR